VVYSRFNDRYQVNVRSYFDRWKEDEGKGYDNEKDPVWRLPPERKPLLVSSMSEPTLASEANWQGNF